ncbi:hypothetical protein LTR36_000924 [Oleoguttula mirabilis]|uniref:Myb-like domain-containing protein n=1 Tax=Oleoguttula mirabilis TaxID=1507867 RepID=A0AAV9JPE8_9PEZI|nr:hypothetical protein LTR36_000924 [Oleoguttula mirabilis]
MTLKYLAGWRPYRIIPLDADTGKPLDPNIGRKTYVTYYNIKKSRNGSNSVVAHRSSAGSVAGGEKGKGGNHDAKKNGSGNGNGKNNGGKNGDGVTWTAEEDARLKALKAENKSWKEIIEEMGRPKHELVARFKEIKDTDAGEEQKDGAGKKGGEGGKKDKNKGGGGANDDGGGTKNDGEGKGKKNKKGDKQQQQTAEEKKAAGLKIAAEKKKEKEEAEKKAAADDKKKTSQRSSGGKAASAAGSGKGEARFTMGEWMTLQEDSLFSFGELQCLSELIMRDQNQTWLRIAAAFYDKTGRRVHPDDIREKFEEMAAMG